jgi:hypothetical protein
LCMGLLLNVLRFINVICWLSGIPTISLSKDSTTILLSLGFFYKGFDTSELGLLVNSQLSSSKYFLSMGRFINGYNNN